MKLLIPFILLSNFIVSNAQWPQLPLSFGGTGYDYASDIVIDNSGNIYITGSFEGSMDIDPSPSNVFLTSAGSDDVFVLKLSNDGNLLWGKSMGGINDDDGVVLTLDDTGNVYVAGTYDESADFDPGQGIFLLTGSDNIFIVKLNTSGDFIWAKGVGGNSYDYVYSIARDANNNILTSGSFGVGGDFDPGPEAAYLYAPSGYGAFILKLTSSGDFEWVRAVDQSISNSIKTDDQNNVYCLGKFNNLVDFDPSTNEHFVQSTGSSDAFLLRLTSTGDFDSVFTFGGPGSDDGKRLAFSNEGDLLVTGTFTGISDFDPSSSQYKLTTNGLGDIFALKLTTQGELKWAVNMGGSDSELVNGLAVDFLDNIILVGDFKAIADLDPGENQMNLISKGDFDGFLVVLTSDGSFQYAYRIGGTSVDDAHAVAVTQVGDALVTGLFTGPMYLSDSDPTSIISSKGEYDAFIIRKSSVTGIENRLPFEIYPNPVNKEMGIIQKSNQDNIFFIHDVLGRLVMSGNLSSENTLLDLGSLSPGVYLISIGNTKDKILKFIKR